MKVSVIIPCYNVESFVEIGLYSIMNQSYKDLEIVCLDDFSTDSTYDRLCDLRSKDSRIKLFRNEKNLGLISTLNKLVSFAENDILIRMDPDDISEPRRIETLVEEYKNNNYDIISSDYSFIDGEGYTLKQIKFKLLNTKLGIKYTAFFNSPIPHPQSLIKKEILKEYPYDELFKAAEDYKLWSILLNKDEIRIKIIDDKLYRYRINLNGMSNLNSKIQSKNHIKIAKEFTAKNLNIDTTFMNFWEISKKEYDFKKVKRIQLVKTINDIVLVYNLFSKKETLNKKELLEVSNYTSQYLIFTYITIFRQCYKINRLKLAFSAVVPNLIRNYKLIFKYDNLLWLTKNK